MTGHIAGAVTWLANFTFVEIIRLWCGAHQLGLGMEHIVNVVVEDRFFAVMTGFIPYLSRQQNFIVAMGTTCPRVGGRRPSTGNVALWFKNKCLGPQRHLSDRQSTSAPSALRCV
jgi:hypothetical protein